MDPPHQYLRASRPVRVERMLRLEIRFKLVPGQRRFHVLQNKMLFAGLLYHGLIIMYQVGTVQVFDAFHRHHDPVADGGHGKIPGNFVIYAVLYADRIPEILLDTLLHPVQPAIVRLLFNQKRKSVLCQTAVHDALGNILVQQVHQFLQHGIAFLNTVPLVHHLKMLHIDTKHRIGTVIVFFQHIVRMFKKVIPLVQSADSIPFPKVLTTSDHVDNMHQLPQKHNRDDNETGVYTVFQFFDTAGQPLRILLRQCHGLIRCHEVVFA